ncbi:MAG TPA: CbiX/SirB N-terminal domain-containing protein [Aggregatilineales bacterium]|nr:hypothetical protein [Anaerolineales bacterium]HRE49516.1 CbiX/SirB N-terminal domain-containing protein [Aggregatilineales bacterium]
MTKTALILAGHGSHISAETAGVIWRAVDAIRVRGAADEVTAAFWKESPSFHAVFASLTATDITVIPLFTARGYFTKTVIPAEMGLHGALTKRDGRLIRYAKPLSAHPTLGTIVRERALSGIRRANVPPDQIAIAVIGHSTRRDPASRRATEDQAAALRALSIAAEVVAVFLDDAPSIPDVYTLTASPTLIAVPFFLAEGSHAALDVPARLGLERGQREGLINGRRLIYTDPVGTGESLVEIILDLAVAGGAALKTPSSAGFWCGFPQAGGNALIKAVEAAGVLPLGDLILSSTEGVFAKDGQNNALAEIITTPDALRTRLRQPQSRFRPLPTAADLPRGWHVPLSSLADLPAVVETIYPGVVADWAAGRDGTFRAGSFGAAIARQTGMFRGLAEMSHARQGEIVASVCGRCVRRPTWFNGELGAIPCAEPCNVWLSEANAVLSTTQEAL